MHLTHSLESILREREIDASVFRWLELDSRRESSKRLLAHDSDMTSTLANFHDSEIGLEVLVEESDSAECCREVILLSTCNDKPVEYGSMQIWLDAFPAREKAPIKWFAYKSAAHTVVYIYSLRRFVKNALNVRKVLLFMGSTTFSVDKTGTSSFQSLKSFPWRWIG